MESTCMNNYIINVFPSDLMTQFYLCFRSTVQPRIHILGRLIKAKTIYHLSEYKSVDS